MTIATGPVIHDSMWDIITQSFLNLNYGLYKVAEDRLWMRNYISRFIWM